MKKIIIQKGLLLDKIAYTEDNLLKKIKIISKNQKYFEKDIFLAKRKKQNISMKSLTLSLDEDTEGFMHYKNDTNEEYILCQVKKLYNNDKNIKMTDEITLSGKYIVYIKSSCGLSISNKSDKKYLLDIFKEQIDNNILENTKIILRSNLDEDNIKNAIDELYSLDKIYKEIEQKAKLLSKPQLIYRQYESEELFLSKINKKIDTLISNDKELLRKLKKSNFDIENIEYDDCYIFEKHSINTQISSLLDDKITLKNKINIFIQKTEAMHIIDVNSGGYIKYKDKNQNAYYVNSLVIPEIARQIELRDISGIILIDFIDMNSDKLADKLIKQMQEYLSNDERKASVISMGTSSLMQIVRKKEDLSLSEILEDGYIKLYSLDYVFEQISEKLNHMGYSKDTSYDRNYLEIDKSEISKAIQSTQNSDNKKSKDTININIPIFESIKANNYVKTLENKYNIKINPIYLKKSDFNIEIH